MFAQLCSVSFYIIYNEHFHVSLVVYLSQKTTVIHFKFLALLLVCYSLQKSQNWILCDACVWARPLEFLESTTDALPSPTQAQLSCSPQRVWTPRAAGDGGGLWKQWLGWLKLAHVKTDVSVRCLWLQLLSYWQDRGIDGGRTGSWLHTDWGIYWIPNIHNDCWGVS